MSDTQHTPAPTTPPNAAASPPSNDPAEVLRELGPAAILAGFASIFPLLGSLVMYTYIDSLGTWLRDHGSLGVAMYIVGFAVLAGTALLPTYASAILGGWAFGLTVGFPAALAGFLGGSLISYAIARPTAANRVEAVLQARPTWHAIRDALIGGSPLRALGIVTLVRIPPNSPFALTNLILASTRVPLWIYLTGTLIGMTPRTGLVLWVASQVRDHVASDAAKTKQPLWIIAVGIAATLVVLIIMGLVAKRALNRVTQANPKSPA